MLNLKPLFVLRDEGSKYASYQAKFLSKSGKFLFSVIAGEHQYSSPREFLEDREYEEVEVAIFNAETGDWATKEEASPVFPFIGEGEYSCWEDSGSCTAVFPYIPVADLEKAWEAL